MGRVLAVIIWIITLGSVSLFFVKKWWFPEAISSHAAALDRQFLLDGVNLNAEDTASPYSTTWNTTATTNGPHTVSARARDAAGNIATAAQLIGPSTPMAAIVWR